MKKLVICLMFMALSASFVNAQKIKTTTGVVVKTIAENRWAGIVIKVGNRNYGIQTDYMPSAGDQMRGEKSWKVKTVGAVWEVGRTVQVHYTKIDSTFDYDGVRTWLKAVKIVEVKNLKSSNDEIESLLSTIVKQTQQPGYHSRDTVYVLVGLGPEEYIYRLSTGRLVSKRKSSINHTWRCGDYAVVSTNILDRDMRALAQGGGQLLKLQGNRWRMIAIAEGEFYRSQLRSVPQSVISCLGIEAF